MTTRAQKHFDIVIIGGLGRVGLPLGLAFAQKGLSVCLYDLDRKNASLVKRGIMPFIEHGAKGVLRKVLQNGTLHISLDKTVISHGKYIIVTIATPIDEYLNPKTRLYLESIKKISQHFSTDQTIIIRSTVFPRMCEQVRRILGPSSKWKIAYCPERTVQGYTMNELAILPQIVAGLTPEATKNAVYLFSKLSPKIIIASVREAELIKLFANAWRYILFAVTNQFYIISQSVGVDYEPLRKKMIDSYGRAANVPTAGFTAGPCLLKDTMQLFAFNNNQFFLGHAAMMVNEGLPNFLVEKLKTTHDLTRTKVGILGMSFKADSDDIRDSLSYKLLKILTFQGAQVYCSDELVKNDNFLTKRALVKKCQVVIVAVPHAAYRGLQIPEHIDVIDLWGITTKLTTHGKKRN